MRKVVIAGNWKMNTLFEEGVSLIQKLVLGLSENHSRTLPIVIVCPPFTYLSMASELCKNSSIMIGGQSLHHEEKGAFTGEISGPMLRDCGCQYVLIGHSERRHYFNEDFDTVSKKFKAALTHGLMPILCVGETLEERELGKTLSIIEDQLLSCLSAVGSANFMVAYEPVWAIGTGKVATPTQAQEVHAFIRSVLFKIIGGRADDISLLYGGSVTPQSSGELLGQEDIDGALVGGASLKAESFLEIIYSQGGVL